MVSLNGHPQKRVLLGTGRCVDEAPCVRTVAQKHPAGRKCTMIAKQVPPFGKAL